MPGPKRKPAEKEHRLGNPSKRKRAAIDAAAAPSATPELLPPAHLSDGVREVWNAYITTPIGQTIVKAGDLPALERLCTYTWEWRIMTAALQDKRCTSGLRLTHTSKRERYGTVTKIRPEFHLRAQLEDKIRQLEASFGANPSARAKVMHDLAETRDKTRPQIPSPPQSPTVAAKSAPPPPSSPIGTIGSRQRPN